VSNLFMERTVGRRLTLHLLPFWPSFVSTPCVVSLTSQHRVRPLDMQELANSSSFNEKRDPSLSQTGTTTFARTVLQTRVTCVFLRAAWAVTLMVTGFILLALLLRPPPPDAVDHAVPSCPAAPPSWRITDVYTLLCWLACVCVCVPETGPL